MSSLVDTIRFEDTQIQKCQQMAANADQNTFESLPNHSYGHILFDFIVYHGIDSLLQSHRINNENTNQLNNGDDGLAFCS